MKRFSFLIIATLLIGCFSLTSCTDMLSSVIDKVAPPDAEDPTTESHEDNIPEQDYNKDMEENIVRIPVGESLRILQLTDMQIIDASQCRNPDRLNDTEKEKWAPENVEKNCFIQIKDLVTQTQPHLILVTGDIVYGEFDDSGKMLRKFVDFMESLNIPWAPVFGNHDKESAIGIDAICNMLESAEHCLFKTETEEFEDGEGNYAVKIYQGNKLIQMVYMLDTKGCTKATDESIRRVASITENQCKFIEKKAAEAKKEAGATVPGILAYHIPSKEFFLAYEEKGYPIEDGIVLGVDVPAEDGEYVAGDTTYVVAEGKVAEIRKEEEQEPEQVEAEEQEPEAEPAEDNDVPESEGPSNEDRLAALEGAVAEIRDGIEALTNAIAALVKRVEDLEGKVSGLEEPAAEPAEEGEETEETFSSKLSYLRKNKK